MRASKRKRASGQAGSCVGVQADRHISRQANSQTKGRPSRQTNICMGGWGGTDRQPDIQMDKKAGG